MVVGHVSLRDFRSYAALKLDLEPGLVLVTGANGVGKTNLLEAVHMGAQGFSPRTRLDAQVVRFGAPSARVALTARDGGRVLETAVEVRHGEGKRAELNGARLPSADALRSRLSALVFLPDRLVVVKGAPAVRRVYLDRVLARLFPAQATVPWDYGRALAQRNEALRRAGAGLSSRDAIAPWTERVASLGQRLEESRAEVVTLLTTPFAERATTLGLEDAALAYEGSAITVSALEERLERDVARGVTTLGPHLGDVSIAAGGRDLRRFGSQGEQRIAVLALLLSEAAAMRDRGLPPPLLLLDDVLSELDEGRRAALVEALPADGQAFVTATSAEALPKGAEPALVVAVRPGEARRT